MGQDTHCNVGVTYHCQYIPENRNIIEKLMQMENISAYIKAEEDSDEVLEITDAIIDSQSKGDIFSPEYLADAADGWYGHEDIAIIGEEVFFKVDVYTAHVRNLSRRRTARPIYDECYTAIGMINTLQQIVTELNSFGIHVSDLSIGHTFTDD
jgi:hypothetical protein